MNVYGSMNHMVVSVVANCLLITQVITSLLPQPGHTVEIIIIIIPYVRGTGLGGGISTSLPNWFGPGGGGDDRRMHESDTCDLFVWPSVAGWRVIVGATISIYGSVCC